MVQQKALKLLAKATIALKMRESVRIHYVDPGMFSLSSLMVYGSL